MSAVDALDLVLRDDGVGLSVLVKPRASRSRVIGVQGDALAVAVAAPPVDGAANAELLRVLARQLGVKRQAIRVVSGAAGRRKVVCIGGLSPEGLRARLSEQP